ncbi:hypothetical protein [Nocardioides pantholopis]|uniref:hypothetical protein n=1 Tax=Nocardioides pantholopis TaxID=2483798 RepID=UPI000FD91E16|nr:hypothetical protein [Nocardioides pantholopis]
MALIPSPADAVSSSPVRLQDRRGDAAAPLDVLAVAITQTRKAVKVTVRVRDYVYIDTPAPLASAVGIHFDTKGTRRPDYLIRMEGFHFSAGSTSGWNRLRPNGLDPWGDWLHCPEGSKSKLISPRPKTNQIVFRAPRACLGNPKSVRVAVQSYRPIGSKVRTDWVKGKKRYSKRLALVR